MLLLLAVVLLMDVKAFEYSGYCSRMCMWGRGGNLCKCSAVHFAGKRTNAASAENRLRQLVRRVYGDAQATEETMGDVDTQR